MKILHIFLLLWIYRYTYEWFVVIYFIMKYYSKVVVSYIVKLPFWYVFSYMDIQRRGIYSNVISHYPFISISTQCVGLPVLRLRWFNFLISHTNWHGFAIFFQFLFTICISYFLELYLLPKFTYLHFLLKVSLKTSLNSL